jgi:hypothetical protein
MKDILGLNYSLCLGEKVLFVLIVLDSLKWLDATIQGSGYSRLSIGSDDMIAHVSTPGMVLRGVLIHSPCLPVLCYYSTIGSVFSYQRRVYRSYTSNALKTSHCLSYVSS